MLNPNSTPRAEQAGGRILLVANDARQRLLRVHNLMDSNLRVGVKAIDLRDYAKNLDEIAATLVALAADSRAAADEISSAGPGLKTAPTPKTWAVVTRLPQSALFGVVSDHPSERAAHRRAADLRRRWGMRTYVRRGDNFPLHPDAARYLDGLKP